MAIIFPEFELEDDKDFPISGDPELPKEMPSKTPSEQEMDEENSNDDILDVDFEDIN